MFRSPGSTSSRNTVLRKARSPSLNHLGTAAWAKTKARVRKAMKDMTDELLKLYAERKTAEGPRFPGRQRMDARIRRRLRIHRNRRPGTGHRRRQARHGIAQPMDRLLCGDVGYGKTEIAMRAAFKAISDNKQVAVLAPTTVLAFQHFETFKQRFAAFPVTIEMISRFRTPRQQKEILQKSGSRQSRHSDRHAPHALEGREVRRPRLAGGGRRAALRRAPQRTHQADAQAGGRADHVSHADSAHLAHVHGRPARHERD